MALEIIASRILAPEFGNSVYIWGSIISVFLAALSLGYVWGGRLADRRPRLESLGLLLLAAAACEVLLLVKGGQIARWASDLTGGSPGGTLLASTVLFGPPSVFLATVSPYAVRIAAQDLAHLGNTAGRLFALSTFGSLLGTLGATFWLIPTFRLEQILGLLLLATAVLGALALSAGGRRSLPWMAVAAVLAIAAFPALGGRAALSEGLLAVRVTPYQTLEVRDDGGLRTLRGDRQLQSAYTLADGAPAMPYAYYSTLALVLNPDIETIAILGMGGGSISNVLRAGLPDVKIDQVELDPGVAELAEEFGFYSEHPLDSIHILDARQFLRRADASWDYIFADAYVGLSVPFHLTTVEFLDIVRDKLTPDGVFGLNLAAGLQDPFSRAMFHTVRERFAQVYPFGASGTNNVVVLATDAPVALSQERWVELARAVDAKTRFPKSLAVLADDRVEAAIDPTQTVLLTDDFAPADHLIMVGGGAGTDATLPIEMQRALGGRAQP